MRIVVISDLHGHLPELPDFDLLIIGGDVCPVTNHNRHFQEDWLNGTFSTWINSLPYRNVFSRVVMIAGNHDGYFEGMSKKKKEDWLSHIKDNRLVYLNNEEYDFEYLEVDELKHIKLFGCPYCKIFGNWAFMRENLEKYYSAIPEGIDILVTHDAADINNLGLIQMGWYKGENAGNTLLAEHVKRVKPKYYFCGHIHSGNHSLEEIDGIKMANVSIMDENYNPTHKPLIIEDYGYRPDVCYPLIGNYEIEIDDGHGTTEGSELIGVFGTYEKALKTKRFLENQCPPEDGCKYASFDIHENFIL